MERKMIKTLTLALALGAAALAPAAASAKFGGPGMGNHVETRGPINATQQRPHIDRPMIKSKVKLLNCHKYPRGGGQGAVVWVSVCT
jgi:type IV pilus biogenesis protein CpaD/CtpE